MISLCARMHMLGGCKNVICVAVTPCCTSSNSFIWMLCQLVNTLFLNQNKVFSYTQSCILFKKFNMNLQQKPRLFNGAMILNKPLAKRPFPSYRFYFSMLKHMKTLQTRFKVIRNRKNLVLICYTCKYVANSNQASFHCTQGRGFKLTVF